MKMEYVNGIAFINLNRKPVNALNVDVLKDLINVIDDIKINPKCRLIL